ncbi:MAG TPA: hypothetical protein PLK64_15450 [Dermatophilaceae bacterium]|jgi:hypothetical protein|nr:hypothetical protein [Dermatophilaceae bacterium]
MPPPPTVMPAWPCVNPAHAGSRLLPGTVVVIVLVLQALSRVEVTLLFGQ